MKKLKQGKMDKKAFWIAMGVVCFIFIMLAVNLETGDVLGDFGRCAVGILGGVIYLAACAMRLRDAGKSMKYLFILFIVPVYAFLIAGYESEETEVTVTDIDMEKRKINGDM